MKSGYSEFPNNHFFLPFLLLQPFKNYRQISKVTAITIFIFRLLRLQVIQKKIYEIRGKKVKTFGMV